MIITEIETMVLKDFKSEEKQYLIEAFDVRGQILVVNTTHIYYIVYRYHLYDTDGCKSMIS